MFPRFTLQCGHEIRMQVFVTVILSYLVFNDELVTLEYVGMTLIMFGMFAVSYGNYRETPREARKTRSEIDQLLINHENY